MAFVQVLTYRTSKRAEMDAVLEQWLADTEDVRRSRRRMLLRDRSNPDCYVELVFFDSYEDAMHNSGLPATTALSAVFTGLVEGGTIGFQDLDVVDETA